MPESSLESIFDFLSRIANTEAAAFFALFISVFNDPDCDTPVAAMVSANNTCPKPHTHTNSSLLIFKDQSAAI